MKYMLEVEPFSHDFMQSQGDKALALKPLEEAAEAFGAWQRYEGDEWDDTDRELGQMMLNDIADELADTVQACVNLADWEGLDLCAALSRVHDRNAERGRHEVRDGCEEARNGCEEGAEPSTDEAERVASALRAMQTPDWPSLTKAVLGRNGTRREVVQGLADMLDQHTEPDSWEKLEADADKTPCSYFEHKGNGLCSGCDHESAHCLDDQRRDIVRRAKELAKAEGGVEE